jgi:Phosphotransferase enzyme family
LASELVKDRPWSTVWRVDGGLWRKQCKSIWRFEAALTASLAARWPDRLPEVVEHGGDWFVMRDAGAVVDGLPNAHALWLEAIARYAELQRGEIAHVEEHLANGVVDQRNHVLPGAYADLLSRDDLPWPPGARERLRSFERPFAVLCDELEPVASINHDDLHIWNVYEGPRILDWGDSCVSHPFFSLVVTFMFVESGHDEIRDAYLEAYGGDRTTFDLALRVGWIAHVFKWIRFRDVLAPEDLAEYDGWFVDWLQQAADQTAE